MLTCVVKDEDYRDIVTTRISPLVMLRGEPQVASAVFLEAAISLANAEAWFPHGKIFKKNNSSTYCFSETLNVY